MKVNGNAIRYGDHVDTDVIIPARYLNITDSALLAKHCMEDLDPDFTAKCKKGDVLVAGVNFGCGSSREHAPLVLKECGISLIIAKSFARIFYRNAINIGLPIVECPEAAQDAAEGDTLEMDFDSGIITNRSKGTQYSAEPFPPFVQKIMQAGGLVQAVRLGVFPE